MSTRKFFKNNKISWAYRATLKIYKCLLHQIGQEIMLLLVNNLLEKYITESQDQGAKKVSFTNIY